ncbi:unnamed protein product [Allacma fusca]|uniref:Uncharacterized protein n=1 Tax=Allacma fusca TaxID=39272 RepID=A0A8J2PWH5_9HEXA|nr:unnamed protein product [Allacma fusca]
MLLFLIFFLLHCTSANYDRRIFSNDKKISKGVTTGVRPQKHNGYLRDPEEEIEAVIYKIGALFDQEDSVEEIALKLAIERFNLRNEESGIKFKGQIDYVEGGSYFVDPKGKYEF